MKILLSLVLFFNTIFIAFSNVDNWKLHPIFDEEVTHVIDTPDYVYFTSRNMALNEWNDVYQSLFRYDKKGEELMALSSSNVLSGNSIRDVIYNGHKGYLFILYKDYNIDLIYDNGKRINLPYYSRTDFNNDKRVNSISLDPGHDRIYLATDFGYVAINDKKNEIAESRVYDEPFQSFCRIGDSYIAIRNNELIQASTDSHLYSLTDYQTICEFDSPSILYPLGDQKCIVVTGKENSKSVKIITKTNSELVIDDIFSATVYNIEYNSSGLTIATDDKIYLLSPDGSLKFLERPENFRNSAAATNNMTEVWNGLKRRGLNSVKLSGNQWKVTRTFMLPNAPSTYASVSFLNHPDKGLLVLNYGYNPQTVGLCESIPFELSSYKEGRWINHAPSYTNPGRTNIMMMTNGMAIDPDNNDYLYVTSCHNGIVRLNLNNAQDILHLSRTNDPDAGNNGFVTLVETSDYLPIFANFSAPYFDSKGNLWMNYADWDDQTNPNPHLYCWTAEDRRDSKTASNVMLPRLVEVDAEVPVSNTAFVVPLLKTGNGILVHVASRYDESVVVVDTNGTPLDTGDDIVYKFPEFRDSDGNSIDVRNIKFLWEDPSTGNVWICHLNGVCYFVPSQLKSGIFEVNRVKVARNDGTNLADYLLDGVTVNHMVRDSDGRKWFATAGGGIVCTSSDGTEIIEEFNTENSPIPDDVVYGIGYNSMDNSLMISTAQGYAEYSLPVSRYSSVKQIKIFPNPVRPEYSGYVTITDIPEGSLVKITDVSGNLVKDLGIMSGFDMLWDISDSSSKRVGSGVYHILVSPSNDNESYSVVGKVLVVS